MCEEEERDEQPDDEPWSVPYTSPGQRWQKSHADTGLCDKALQAWAMFWWVDRKAVGTVEADGQRARLAPEKMREWRDQHAKKP
jgi:hypothetical protein